MAPQRLRNVVTVLLLCAGLAACDEATSDESSAEELMRQDWVAEAINDQAVISPGRVTLGFTEDRVSGRSGCNLYSGPAEIGPGTLKIGALISTKMACAEPGLMQQEAAYLNALRSAERYSFGADGKLIIATGSGAITYSGAPRQRRPEGS